MSLNMAIIALRGGCTAKMFVANLDEIQAAALSSKYVSGNKILLSRINGQICVG
jgi:hypothetical protein